MATLSFQLYQDDEPIMKLAHNTPDAQLLENLSEEDTEQLFSKAKTYQYAKNTIIIQEGDLGDSLYILQSGRAKVYLADANGKEIVLSTLKSGDYFGEMSLIDHQPRSASIMTLEKSTITIVTSQEFEKTLMQNPAIALNLIKGLNKTLRLLTDNVRSLALMDVYGRVARVLMTCAKPKLHCSDTFVIDEPMTHQDMANRVGASREMISRILKDLSKGGYIHNKGKHIEINGRLPARY